MKLPSGYIYKKYIKHNFVFRLGSHPYGCLIVYKQIFQNLKKIQNLKYFQSFEIGKIQPVHIYSEGLSEND
jgi:hypothetical protein